jgi:hypothetical protein
MQLIFAESKVMQIELRTNKLARFYAEMQLIFAESKVMLPPTLT